MTKHLFLLTFILVLLASCNSNKKVTKEESGPVGVEVIEAWKSNWNAGAKGFGSGVNYKIKLLVLNSKFKSTGLCVDQKLLVTKESNSVGFISSKEFTEKGDTIIISSTWSGNEKYEECNLTDTNIEAILHYQLFNTKKEIAIPSFIVKQAAPRP